MTTAPSPALMEPKRPTRRPVHQYMGRVLSRSPITETSRLTTGTLQTLTGSTIQWGANSGLVELYIEVFNSPQIVVAGRIRSDGILWLDAVRPVLAEEWAEAIAGLIVSRYSTVSSDQMAEEARRRKIAELVLTMAVPIGVTPSEARQKARKRRPLHEPAKVVS